MGVTMRATYREQLDDVLDGLVRMADDVAIAVGRATHALLTADLQTAEGVIAGDERLDRAMAVAERSLFELLARQAPVAGELRLVVASLRMVAELERMGDLAAHVAKIARLRYPGPAVPDRLRPSFTRMADVAEAMVRDAGQALAERSPTRAAALRDQDEEMDRLRRGQFTVLLGGDWADGVEAAVDAALLGRYYERIADHATTVARRVAYIVTGESVDDDWPEP